MKVKAAVVNEVNGPYEFEELDLQEIQHDEVIVKVVASGICHSDEALRVGDAEYPLPVVLGHEGAGIIEKTGASVKGFEVGDQVVMAYNSCGSCPNCRTGHPSSCVEWTILNMSGARSDGSPIFKKTDGTPVSSFFAQSSFATHTVTNVHNLIKVAPDADLRLVGPLGCGFLTGAGTVVNGLKPNVGESIVIFGTGAVGLGALMTAKIEGCGKIIAVDIHDSRLEIAKELGATHTINSKTEDLAARIAEITAGAGANYSIDTTGVSAVMKASLDVLGIQGVAAPVAVTPNSIELNTFMDLVLLNKTIKGVLMGDSIPQLAIPKLIEFHKQGQFAFDKLVQFYNFDDINQASADSNSGKTIKPILIIDETYRAGEPLLK
ncbi:NAD(P)-dependent alcohol dehydrogenase [Kurthia huakuii]|uniref:NAD(P)-dependent alcohol dehydrogenase n=1 Tax=Kurthia huakuii TaxID=1421019 RepID=UPI000496DEBC|nr:NAD(P)-dependent alcohol dehydrogenase [Kurthia huakuii]MBM7700502.1 aryl-alcohol dehydrogenase [Kurthia huakuii]